MKQARCDSAFYIYRISWLIMLALTVLLISACSMIGEEGGSLELEPTQSIAQGQDSEATIAAADTIATLPPPVIAEASNTPIPATATPEPTDTPEITATPAVTEVPPTETSPPIVATNTQAPIPPTNPPPPTNTPEPTQPPPPPLGANGLIASNFEVQDRSDFVPDGKVWFGFTVSNSTSGEVPYNAIGVMPKKDGVDRFEWYQNSYGGPNSTIKPGGLTWEDHIRLPETGNYTLRLVVCFDGYDNCRSGGGVWHNLSQEISIRIN